MPKSKVKKLAEAITKEAEGSTRSASVITDAAVSSFLSSTAAPQFDVNEIADDDSSLNFGQAYEQALFAVSASYRALLDNINRKTVLLAQTYMLDALQGLAAWVEGAAATMPNTQQVYARLWAVQRIAFQQDHARDLRCANTSDFLRVRTQSFMQRYTRLARKAMAARKEAVGGSTTFEVLVRVSGSVPTTSEHARAYLRAIASKLFFSGENFKSQIEEVVFDHPKLKRTP